MKDNEQLRQIASEIIKKLVDANDLDNIRLLLGDCERADEKLRAKLLKDN